MAKVVDQNIPEGLYQDLYKVMHPANRWKERNFGRFRFGAKKFGISRNPYSIKRRYPWELPDIKKYNKDYPSQAQLDVREAFKKSCDCFNKQLDIGGVDPPKIGYRNKFWWYGEAAKTALRYYNYFIHVTLPIFLAGETPIWCKPRVMEDSYVHSGFPDTNYGTQETLYIQLFSAPGGDGKLRSYIETPFYDTKTLSIYNYFAEKNHGNWLAVGAYAINPALWAEHTITWNNQPALGDLLDTQTINNEGWWTWNIGNAKSVCLKFIDETWPVPPARALISHRIRSREYAEEAFRPYTTET